AMPVDVPPPPLKQQQPRRSIDFVLQWKGVGLVDERQLEHLASDNFVASSSARSSQSSITTSQILASCEGKASDFNAQFQAALADGPMPLNRVLGSFHRQAAQHVQRLVDLGVPCDPEK